MSRFATVDQLMNVGLGFWASKTLLSAVELELFTVLAKGPKDLESLERELACIRDLRGIF